MIFPNYREIIKSEEFDIKKEIRRLFIAANKEIVIIDPYLSNESLFLLESAKKNLDIFLIKSSKASIKKEDIDDFKNKYEGVVGFSTDDEMHDRIIVIDDKLFYHIGASLNYLGVDQSSLIIKIISPNMKNFIRNIIRKDRVISSKNEA